jgi:hypothetical protein
MGVRVANLNALLVVGPSLSGCAGTWFYPCPWVLIPVPTAAIVGLIIP